jgi:hypothetical protein
MEVLKEIRFQFGKIKESFGALKRCVDNGELPGDAHTLKEHALELAAEAEDLAEIVTRSEK